MPTANQLKQLEQRIRVHNKKYSPERIAKLDEASTRLVINSFLTGVLGYEEFTEIKTEQRIKGQFVDYLVE